MSTRTAAAVLSLVVLLIGLVVGLVPHSIPTADNPQQSSLSCGSAFAPRDVKSDATGLEYTQTLRQQLLGDQGQLTTTDSYIAQCSDAEQTPRIIAFVLIGLGVLAGLFLLMTSTGKGAQQAATPAPEDTADRA